MKFVDQVRIHGKAGSGGNGCCSFRREKFIPRGGPDGGNGGQGGSIILEADVHTDNLVSLYYDPNRRADKGGHGQGKGKHGRGAADTIIKVPVGTLIYKLPEREDELPYDPEDHESHGPRAPEFDPDVIEPLIDLAEPGQQFTLCAGGKGGKGNTCFKTSTNRAPRRTTDGEEGEEGWFGLELRTIADVGLIGYPNAGKSTLLTKISAAHPKVAPYPFTTLNPVVGVVEIGGFKRITVADIPGLIEGASENKGLGHEFLRHVVRCKMLLFVVDMGGSDGRDPIEDLQSLRKELKLYDPTLATRPWAIVANKMDLEASQENAKHFRKKFAKAQIIRLSAMQGDGLDQLMTLLAELDITPAPKPVAEALRETPSEPAEKLPEEA